MNHLPKFKQEELQLRTSRVESFKEAEMCDQRFAVFPKITDEEKHLFELLKRAYIDARYKMDEYTITKGELEYLAERVNELKRLTEKICKAKIGEIGTRH
ncbi:hypothetical protein [Flagellimonas pacifica]|uniref:hypothetical protein n=1 Tax=Flagellimonas pacifica TaxID=1247520 RepID=UPI000BE39E8A|nr:hypothetical protein [Allomuricauda parva]